MLFRPTPEQISEWTAKGQWPLPPQGQLLKPRIPNPDGVKSIAKEAIKSLPESYKDIVRRIINF